MSPETSKRANPLINRNFAMLWTGQSISSIGDFVFDTTLVLWVATRIGAGQPWAAAAVSGVLLAVLVPTIVFGPLAGVFVDRWDKRRTMLTMDVLRALLILALLPLTGLVSVPGAPSLHPNAGVDLGIIYATVILATVCGQFFGPAQLALVGDIVSEQDRSRASGLEQVTSGLAGVIGPPLAAPLLFGIGLQWALVINSLSFVASYSAVWLVEAPESARSVEPGAKRNAGREFRHGLTFFAGNRTLVTIVIAVSVTMLGAGALNALDIFFVTTNLHTAPNLYGWLSAAFSVGAIAGGILAGVVSRKIGPARMLWGGMLAAGAGILVYSRLSSFLPAVILLGVLALPVSGVNIAIMPLILRSTPRDLIGRVAAVLQPAISLASIGSIAVAGLLVSTVLHNFHASLAGMTFGPIDTVFAGGAVLVIIGGIFAMVRLERSTVMAETETHQESAASREPNGETVNNPVRP